MNDQVKHLEDAVQSTPEVNGCFKKGLQALLRRDRAESLISCGDPKKIQGSIYLDQATKEYRYPFDNRWDYAIEYDNKIYYYEPHPASGGDKVKEVNGKADWLLWWLKNKAPEIKALGTAGLYWVHAGKSDIDKNSQQYKRLTVKGVQLKSKLNMK